MSISIRQEVDIEISIDDLLEQVSVGDIISELDNTVRTEDIIKYLDTSVVLDAIADREGLDVILNNFATKRIIRELVEEYGVENVQDYVNEHHASIQDDRVLCEKLKDESLEDVMSYLGKKYEASALLSTLAIAMSHKESAKESQS